MRALTAILSKPGSLTVASEPARPEEVLADAAPGGCGPADDMQVAP